MSGLNDVYEMRDHQRLALVAPVLSLALTMLKLGPSASFKLTP